MKTQDTAFEQMWAKERLLSMMSVTEAKRVWDAAIIQTDEKLSDTKQAPLKEESWKIVAQQYETAIKDLQNQLRCRPTMGDVAKELSQSLSRESVMRSALTNIMAYLAETDELGEEYLSQPAAKHYYEAKAALASSGSERDQTDERRPSVFGVTPIPTPSPLPIQADPKSGGEV